jgi:aryl-alcohol dehydrogenase-like predicted oxidoreductase
MHTPGEENALFLDEAVKSGKIHYIGLSNFTGWQLQLIISTAKAMGDQIPVTLQAQYSLLGTVAKKLEGHESERVCHREGGIQANAASNCSIASVTMDGPSPKARPTALVQISP